MKYTKLSSVIVTMYAQHVGQQRSTIRNCRSGEPCDTIFKTAEANFKFYKISYCCICIVVVKFFTVEKNYYPYIYEDVFFNRVVLAKTHIKLHINISTIIVIQHNYCITCI